MAPSEPEAAAAEALQELMAGNRRFAAGCPEHPRQSPEVRQALVEAQAPLAAVLTCADSRVPPELIFDRGLGELFVVRVAGNIADAAVIASLEYAAEHLGVPLVVVMGHTRCGAVTAAAQARAAGEASGHLSELIAAIRPAVEQSRGQPGDRIDNAARRHVTRVVELLRSAGPALGRLQVLGAFYDLRSGIVELV